MDSSDVDTMVVSSVESKRLMQMLSYLVSNMGQHTRIACDMIDHALQCTNNTVPCCQDMKPPSSLINLWLNLLEILGRDNVLPFRQLP